MQRLLLFDYDGPCVKPGVLTYDTLIKEVNNTLDILGYHRVTDVTIEGILKRVVGTTERNFIRQFCQQLSISHKEFFKYFLELRRTHLSLINREEASIFGNDYIDQSYPDGLFFCENQMQIPETQIWLVTGNPRVCMKERLRLNSEWINIFCIDGRFRGAFGDEADSREELISLAITRAVKSGFVVNTNNDGWVNNVFYFGDSVNDLVAGIKKKIRTVFIPRDGLKDPLVTPRTYLASVLFNLERDNLELRDAEILSALGQEVKDFMPGAIYVSTFYNPRLASYVQPELWSDSQLIERVEQAYLREVENACGGWARERK